MADLSDLLLLHFKYPYEVWCFILHKKNYLSTQNQISDYVSPLNRYNIFNNFNIDDDNDYNDDEVEFQL